MRVATANFIKDDLAKVGHPRHSVADRFQHAHHEPSRAISSTTRCCWALQSGVPPDPANGQNFWRSSRRLALLGSSGSRSPPRRKRRASISWVDSRHDARSGRAEGHLEGNPDHLERAGLVVWLPILNVKMPVSNRFGNLQPSIMAHRILWNIDRCTSNDVSPLVCTSGRPCSSRDRAPGCRRIARPTPSRTRMRFHRRQSR